MGIHKCKSVCSVQYLSCFEYCPPWQTPLLCQIFLDQDQQKYEILRGHPKQDVIDIQTISLMYN
jgi:hypothetical protein